MTELEKKVQTPSKKPSIYRRLRNWWLSFNFIKRWVTVWTTLLITYTLLGFFAVPAIVKHTLTTELTQLLGRTVSIEKIYWNPFSLVFEMENFKLLDSKQKDATFSLDHLHLNLETASLYKWSLVVKQIEVTHPQLKVSRVGMKSFSFDDIIRLVQQKIEESQSAPQVEDKSPSLLSKLEFEVTDIAIHRGMFYFNDKFAMKNHSITDFEFVIPKFSNFSKGKEEFIQPLISGKINGSTFGGKSQLKPFIESRESLIDLKFKDFDLAFLTKYLPKFVKPKLVSCMLDSELSLAFDMNKHDQPYLSLHGGFSVRDIDVTLDHDYGSGLKPKSIFKLDRLRVDFGKANLLAKQVLIKNIEVIKPYAMVNRHKDGKFNLEYCWDQGLLNQFIVDLELKENKKPVEPFSLNLEIESLLVEEGKFQIKDNHDSRNYQTTIDHFNLSMQDFSTTDKKPAQIKLALTGSKGLVVKSTGKLSFHNKKLNLELIVSGVELTQFSPYYQPFLNCKLDSGVVSLDSHVDINFDDSFNVTVTDTDVKLQNFLVVNQKDKDLIEVPLVDIKLSKLSLKEKMLNVSSVLVDGGGINLVRSKNFDINLTKMVKLKKIESFISSITKTGAKKEAVKTTPATEFSYAINQVQVKSFGLSLLDQALITESELVIFPINISVNNFSSDQTQPIALKFDSAINTNSEIKLDANIFIDQTKIEANLAVKDFRLRLLNPYLTQLLKIHIQDGYFNTSSDLAINFKDLKQPKIKLKSTYSVDQFLLKMEEKNNNFVGGSQIKVTDFTFTNMPLKVEVGKLFVDQLSASFELKSKKPFTIETLVQQKRLEELVKEQKSLVSIIENYIKHVESFNMAIEETQVIDATFHFADRTVKPHYEMNVVKTNLTLDRIDTSKPKDSNLKLEITTLDGSTLDLVGKINPFTKPFSANFTANVVVDDLSRFTPYSGKYVGYEIDKGKSKLVLNYKVENNKLTASNDVFINQFTFGNDVDSDEATSLPVRFALAIITDKNGDLELKLPVSGDLNDPSFSISSAIWTVTKNIVTNIVSSPFSFLASLHGGGEDINQVDYQAGSSKITEAELKKLELLAKILHDRPGLKVDITAYATKDIDFPAILDSKLTKFIQERWYIQLSENDQAETTPSEIKVDKNDKENYFKMVEQAYETSSFKKERNFLNMIKSQPLEYMLNKLKNHLKVTDQEFYKLAVSRGQVINTFLHSKKIAHNRVFLTEPKIDDSEVKISATVNLK